MVSRDFTTDLSSKLIPISCMDSIEDAKPSPMKLNAFLQDQF